MLTRRRFTQMFGTLPFLSAHGSGVLDPNSLAVPAPYIPGDPTPNYFPDWNNPNGKEPVDLSSLTGKTLVIGFITQSNGTNVMPSLYTPTNRLGVINFNIGDGGAYRARPGGPIDPLLGCTGPAPNLPSPWPNGNWLAILADLLISAGIAVNVIIVPIGVGGSYAADWAVGGADNLRIGVMARRLAAAGLPNPHAMLYCQGESDLYTTFASYFASLTSAIWTSKSFFPTTPFFVAVETYNHGYYSSAVAAAQAAVVNPAAGVLAGANGDILIGANRQSDMLHFSDVGGFNFAQAWKTILHAYGSPF